MGWTGAAVLTSVAMFLLALAKEVRDWLRGRGDRSASSKTLAQQQVEYVITMLRAELERKTAAEKQARRELHDERRARARLEAELELLERDRDDAIDPPDAGAPPPA